MLFFIAEKGQIKSTIDQSVLIHEESKLQDTVDQSSPPHTPVLDRNNCQSSDIGKVSSILLL